MLIDTRLFHDVMFRSEWLESSWPESKSRTMSYKDYFVRDWSVRNCGLLNGQDICVVPLWDWFSIKCHVRAKWKGESGIQEIRTVASLGRLVRL